MSLLQAGLVELRVTVDLLLRNEWQLGPDNMSGRGLKASKRSSTPLTSSSQTDRKVNYFETRTRR